jgi:hypothetical protein
MIIRLVPKSMTTSTTGKYVANPGGGVMMQAFTGTPAGGNWWNTLGTKVTVSTVSVQFPPVSKAKTVLSLWDTILLIILIGTQTKMEL